MKNFEIQNVAEVQQQRMLADLRSRNNPDELPSGHFTGRCGKCGSKDLWDDATAYGCNCCGEIYFTG